MKKLLPLLLILIYSYLSFSQKQEKAFVCGVNDSNLSPETIRQMQMAPTWLKQRNESKISTNERYICRIAIEIDSETYNLFGGDTTLIKYEVMKQINMVSKIYEKEINTQLIVTLVHFWKDPNLDPYRVTYDIFQLLSITNKVRLTDPMLKSLDSVYDKIMYITTRDYSGAGGVAVMGGKECVVKWGTFYTLLAHELGHNFGSPHTQSCDWPNGPIDYCYPAEANCYEKSLENSAGTFMSYCINIKQTFHPMCQVLMQNYAKTYFQKIASLPLAPVLPSSIAFENSTIISWQPVSSAEKYLIEASNSPNFNTLILSDSSEFSAYNFKSSESNNRYFIRVKSVNRFGESAWSNISVINIPDSKLLPPEPMSPLNNSVNFFQNRDVTLKFKKVASASSYEVQITQYNDPYFSYPTPQVALTNEFTFRLPEADHIFWRVRAIKGSSIKSPWSEANSIWLNNKDIDNNNLITIPSKGINLPQSFPIGYSPIKNASGATVRFIISNNEDFTVPVITKTFLPSNYSNRYYTCMAEDLSPNTTYFVKVEQFYEQNGFLPPGIKFSSIQTFKTGSKKASNRWSFINNDKNHNLERDIYSIISGKDNIFIQNSQGIVKISIDSLKETNINIKNTNGSIGNIPLGISTVDYNNTIWVINQISKRNVFDGVFPRPVYSLSQIDQLTGKTISETELINLENTTPMTLDMVNKIIYCNSKNSTILYRLEGNTIIPFLKTDKNVLTNRPVWNDKFAWTQVYNQNSREYELWQYDLITKNYIIHNKYNDPGIGNSFADFGLDSKGNYWAIAYDNHYKLLKFDGAIWQTFDETNSIIDTPSEIGFDNWGNIFVVDNNRILKYDGKNWKEVGRTPFITNPSEKKLLSDMIVDSNGNLWFNNIGFGLLRFTPCDITIIKPELSASKTILEYGESTYLKAEGCTNVLWNWQNAKYPNEELYNPGKIELKITPNYTTTYTARCYEQDCTSNPTNLTITVSPTITLDNIINNTFCQGDSLKVIANINGDVNWDNEFNAYFLSNKNLNHLPLITYNYGSHFQFPLSNSIPAGKYYLKMTASSPKMLSKDSLEINILATPSVTATGAAGCIGANISIGATGGDSYLWKGPNSFTSSLQNPAFSNINSSYAGAYLVTVTGTNGCRNTGTANVVVNPNPNATASVSSVVYEGLDVQLLASGGTSYSWSGPGNYSSAEQNPIIKRISKSIHAGTYVVNVTDANGCKANAQTELKIETALANEQESNTDFKVYPNPASDKIQIVTGLEGEATIQLYDASGKEISTQIFLRQTTIPVRNLARGTYFFIIQQKDKKTTGKVRLE
ncbi:M12 family metallo-peptidase [Pseudarcicella hirudinis]|uniref:M12 family metallo-peptidase n=1 Tax=Pseudarcicella hirudinis TaxID=1079859 RepID=UPI0036291218